MNLDLYWTIAPLAVAAAAGVITGVVLLLTRDKSRTHKAGE